MEISVDLTLSPLQDDFEQHVIDFIKALRDSKFTVLENPLSTQIFGNYDELMPFLNKAIKNSFENQDICVLTMKVVKTNRSTYEPHF
ncbi:thiamine-binding protein [Algibacter sp. R77976]|uniref:thiamine-binding protein n=1 Tax=Algibacter sp. R77976 TaxID=3093873 RepID=UPI0037CA7EA5